MHYLCLIREIVSLILIRVIIQRWVITRVVIQPLNRQFTLNYDRVCCLMRGSVLLSLFNIFTIFFLSTVKAHTDPRKKGSK